MLREATTVRIGESFHQTGHRPASGGRRILLPCTVQYQAALMGQTTVAHLGDMAIACTVGVAPSSPVTNKRRVRIRVAYKGTSDAQLQDEALIEGCKTECTNTAPRGGLFLGVPPCNRL